MQILPPFPSARERKRVYTMVNDAIIGARSLVQLDMILKEHAHDIARLKQYPVLEFDFGDAIAKTVQSTESFLIELSQQKEHEL